MGGSPFRLDGHPPAPSLTRAQDAASDDLRLPPLRSVDMSTTRLLPSSSQRPSRLSPEPATATSTAHDACPGSRSELASGFSSTGPSGPAPSSHPTWNAVNKPRQGPQPEGNSAPAPVVLPSLAQFHSEHASPMKNVPPSIFNPPSCRSAQVDVVTSDRGPNYADADDDLSPPLAKKARLSVDQRRGAASPVHRPNLSAASGVDPKEPLSPAPSPDATCYPGAYQKPHSKTPSSPFNGVPGAASNDVSGTQNHKSASHSSKVSTSSADSQLGLNPAGVQSTVSHGNPVSRRPRRSVTFNDEPHLVCTAGTTDSIDSSNSLGNSNTSSASVDAASSVMRSARPGSGSIISEPPPTAVSNKVSTSRPSLDRDQQNILPHDITWASRACPKCGKTWRDKHQWDSLFSLERPNSDYQEHERAMLSMIGKIRQFRNGQENDYDRWLDEHDCQENSDSLALAVTQLYPPAEVQERALSPSRARGSSATISGDAQQPQTSDRSTLASPSSIFSTPPPDIDLNYVLRAPEDTETTKYLRLSDGGWLSENYQSADYLYSKKLPAPLVTNPLERTSATVLRGDNDSEGTKYYRTGPDSWISEAYRTAQILFPKPNASAIERNLGDEMDMWDSSKITADGRTKARKRTQGEKTQ